MSEFGNHPFVDPHMPHGYEGTPPNVFANPNDFTNEHDWYGVNDTIERQLREQAWSASNLPYDIDFEPEVSASEAAVDESWDEVVERVGETVADLLEFTQPRLIMLGLGYRHDREELHALFNRLEPVEVTKYRRLIVHLASFWRTDLVSGIADINQAIDELFYPWIRVCDSVELLKKHNRDYSISEHERKRRLWNITDKIINS